MPIAPPVATAAKAIRLWPGVALAILLVLSRFVLPVLFPTMFFQGVVGALLCVLLIVLWWLFLSRAPWPARVGAIVVMGVALWTTSLLAHPSIAAGMGFVLPAYIAPVLGLALVAAAAGYQSSTRQWVPMVGAIGLACGVFTVLRTDGVTGDAASQLTWRWMATAEERLLAQANDESRPPAPAAIVAAKPSEPIARAAEPSVAPAPAKTEPPVRAAEVRFAAIDGKTWNHPVLVRDLLLVRNGEEMAAFRLAMSGK